MRTLPVVGLPSTLWIPGIRRSPASTTSRRPANQRAGYRIRRRPRTACAISYRIRSVAAVEIVVAEEPVRVPERRRPRQRSDRTAREVPHGPQRERERDEDTEREPAARDPAETMIHPGHRLDQGCGHRRPVVRYRGGTG